MSGSDGRPVGDQPGDSADRASPGLIPPSFGASSTPPPQPEPPAVAPIPPAPAADPTPAPAADPAPDPGDGATVGWYPSGSPGQPAAGPFATPSAPARRGLSLSRLARLGGSAGRLPAWGRGRGTLMNVLLFGISPLALAGIVVAAFVLVAPGKGSASSLSFRARPAPSPSQATAGASPSPSPSAHKKHPHASRTASPSAKAPVPSKARSKAKATPKPPRKSSGSTGGVVPHNLGQPNFAGYCQHIGHRTAELIASNAYGWRCTLFPNQVLQVDNACAWTYHLSKNQVIDVSANYYDPGAWQCWRINRDLGVLNVTAYCVDAGLGTSKLVAEDVYGWDCTSPSSPVNTTAACDLVYHVSDAVSRFAVFADPYSWQCWN